MVQGMSNLKEILKNLDVSNLKLKNGKSVEAELKKHAAILADCIIYQLVRCTIPMSRRFIKEHTTCTTLYT